MHQQELSDKVPGLYNAYLEALDSYFQAEPDHKPIALMQAQEAYRTTYFATYPDAKFRDYHEAWERDFLEAGFEAVKNATLAESPEHYQ